jgi:hypothetical protein
MGSSPLSPSGSLNSCFWPGDHTPDGDVYVEGVDELDEQVDERVDFCETKVFLFWWLESPSIPLVFPFDVLCSLLVSPWETLFEVMVYEVTLDFFTVSECVS